MYSILKSLRPQSCRPLLHMFRKLPAPLNTQLLFPQSNPSPLLAASAFSKRCCYCVFQPCCYFFSNRLFYVSRLLSMRTVLLSPHVRTLPTRAWVQPPGTTIKPTVHSQRLHETKEAVCALLCAGCCCNARTWLNTLLYSSSSAISKANKLSSAYLTPQHGVNSSQLFPSLI